MVFKGKVIHLSFPFLQKSKNQVSAARDGTMFAFLILCRIFEPTFSGLFYRKIHYNLISPSKQGTNLAHIRKLVRIPFFPAAKQVIRYHFFYLLFLHY